uniref:Sulfotransferase domain-containing protein n=1 Tax=Timema douglasi TaxID=61478 RepID=A0A7R8VQT1_TIMDO|nr:unnamed protein product [Timema douglasi]
MSRRGLDFAGLLNKKSFALTLLLFACVLYLSYSFNSCLVANLNRALRQQRSHGGLLSYVGTAAPVTRVPESREHGIKKETVVRVVPLTWTGVQDPASMNGNETSDLVDGSPKYRFLRHQGLRPTRKLPDALIIGVKKGGTRALLEFIRLHPDVRAAGSEIHFFDRFHDKGFQWYSKKPGMLRFEELAFLNGTGGSGLVDTSWGPVKIGVYARHLERWLHCFPLDQMLFVSGERLIVDPAAEMARVQDFLGLKQVITEKHFYFNSTKGFPCLMKSEGRSTPHCLGKTKGRNHPNIDTAAVERLREFYRPFNARFYQLTGINFGWP